MGKKKTAMVSEEVAEEKIETPEEEKSEKKAKKVKKTAGRSRNYKNALAKIDRNKLYPLAEAVKLAQETSYAKFESKIELHLTVKEAKNSGEINFPHPTGKSQRIAIADDKLLEEIQNNKLDFDVLVATPAMMKKIAPLAKILGPKGLMPNPKKGTITDDPEALVKQMSGKTQYKTEKKAPLIHLVVGSQKQKTEEVVANIEAAMSVVGKQNLRKAVVKGSMGPGVKIEL